MEDNKCCGTCKWHRCESCDEWACDCPTSDYYSDYTEYEDLCLDWEAR